MLCNGDWFVDHRVEGFREWFREIRCRVRLVFFEGVRGSGGTARLVLLPYEDHGYRARESVEHVLWEQLRWFDLYVKGAGEPRE